MRPTRGSGPGVGRRLAGSGVDSRWWYWVAAVPLTFGLWAVAVGWVAVAVAAGPFDGGGPLRQAVEVSMIAFGVPVLALIAVFPFAVYADAGAIRGAEVEWRPPRAALAVAAAVGPSLAAGRVFVDLVSDGALDGPGWAVGAGFLVCVPVAGYYLYRRHVRLGVP